MPKLTFGKTELYYQEYGKGEPLLMIAGLGSDSTSWLPVIVPLSNNYRVIVFDNRGVGRSTSNNSGITIYQMEEDVVRLIEQLNLDPVNIIGHSMGGMIAMQLAANNPKLVKNLVLSATSTIAGERNKYLLRDMAEYGENGMDKYLWFRNLFYWIFAPAFFNDRAMVEQALNMAVAYRFPQSPESFSNQVEAIINFDGTECVQNIFSNTLLIGGSEDLLFPASESEKLLSGIKGMESVIIQGAAHSIHMDKPNEFIKTVEDFLG